MYWPHDPQVHTEFQSVVAWVHNKHAPLAIHSKRKWLMYKNNNLPSYSFSFEFFTLPLDFLHFSPSFLFFSTSFYIFTIFSYFFFYYFDGRSRVRTVGSVGFAADSFVSVCAQFGGAHMPTLNETKICENGFFGRRKICKVCEPE